MGSLIPFLILGILALPIILVVTLASLASKLKNANKEIASLSRRLSAVELEMVRLQEERRFTSVSPAAAEPVPAHVPEDEPVLPVEPAPFQAAMEPPILPAPEFSPPLVSQPETLAPAFAPQPRAPAFQLDWEQFMGVKLFAWIGGFALFLGVAFFIKYSFDRNLISPEMRVTIGFLLGIALVAAGVLMRRREFAVTAHTLCATGVVILYAVTFACRSVYHFAPFGPGLTFWVMVLITATAFTLSVQLNAMVVAILGLLGGFLTPALLGTTEDKPVALFTYIAFLDLGLTAVALRRRWHFLVPLAAAGTALTQLAWVAKFFVAAKIWTAFAVFAGFDLLFLLTFIAAEKTNQGNPWSSFSSIGLSLTTLVFGFYLLGVGDLSARPGLIFSFVLGADLCLAALVLIRPDLHPAHLLAGGIEFVLLASWTMQSLAESLLTWALGLYLVFAALHTFYPLLLRRARPQAESTWSGQLFPAATLLLMLIPLLKQGADSLQIWPAVLLLDVLAVVAAMMSASIATMLAVLLLTSLLTGVWILRVPGDLAQLPVILTVIGSGAGFFFVAGLFGSVRILARKAELKLPPSPLDRMLGSLVGEDPASARVQIPTLSSILPFLLLIMVSSRLPLTNPSPVFGLGMALGSLLLGLALASGLDALAPISLLSVLALQYTWHAGHFETSARGTALSWYLGFYAVYTVFPFLFESRLAERRMPWATSALAGPLHFALVYWALSPTFPESYLGLLPAAFAVPMLLAAAYTRRVFASGDPVRLSLLAWFGGSALFFITAIFPIQFDRQWITVGWALEGAALLWLFGRVPHPGLRATGVALLTVSFVRLGLNPGVLEYQRGGGMPILNWYLYAYGVVTVCLMVGARLLAPPRHLLWGRNVPPFLYTLGTILAFLLLNIEIADYFSEGPALTLQFSGSFARDMSYSMAWAFFALGLLVVGIWRRLPSCRYAAIGLLSVTLFKLFLHDLSRLAQLYRIGAFVVVAVILILASFLYQKFVSFEAKRAP